MALERLGLDDQGWTPRQVLDALDVDRAERGLYAIHAGRQRSPVAVFVTEARRAGLAEVEPPRWRERRRREAVEHARQERAKDAARAREQAAEPQRVDAHLAGIREQLRQSSGRHLRPRRGLLVPEGATS